jgi:sec-independent protein translocase protein TatA
VPFGLGIGEILIILVLVVLLFGARRIPEIARGLGQGIREFKREVKDDDSRTLGDGEDRPER